MIINPSYSICYFVLSHDCEAEKFSLRMYAVHFRYNHFFRLIQFNRCPAVSYTNNVYCFLFLYVPCIVCPAEEAKRFEWKQKLLSRIIFCLKIYSASFRHITCSFSVVDTIEREMWAYRKWEAALQTNPFSISLRWWFLLLFRI